MQVDNPLLARILIVDDSAENVRLLTRILHRAGYTEITGLTDSRSVVDTVKEIAPDLVILDLHMPHANGFAVMHQVRSLVDQPPKFLLVTGDSDEGIRPLALARGADELLPKPFQIVDALTRIRFLLDLAPPAAQ